MKCNYFNISFILVLLVGTVISISKRKSRKSDSPLLDWQKQFLEKIQVAAKESGLPESEVKSITKYDKDICYEKPCLESALEVMQATNFSADPCKPNMWYEYVCSRRVNSVDNINQVERTSAKVTRETIDILDNGLPNGKGDDYMLKEAQVIYHQCKNKAHHDKQDVKDILAHLSENYGEWPMLTNKEPGPKFNWFNMVADINRIDRVGSEPLLLKITVGRDIGLEVGKTSFSTSQNDFITMLPRVQNFSGQNRPVRLEQLSGMVSFLSYVAYSATSSSKDMAQWLTIAEMQNQTDALLKKRRLMDANINWLKFFQRVLKGSGIELNEESPTISVNMKQILRIVEAVERHQQRDRQSLSNALNFNYATILLQESTALLDDLNSFKCTEEAGTREQICYARTIDTFGLSLGKTYLSVHYNDAVTSPAIKKLMAKIQDGYIGVIDSYDWMENSTKEYLKDKIQSMKFYVGAAPISKDPKKLKKFFSGLKASSDHKSSYPMNYLSVMAWATAKKREWTYRMASVAVADFTMYDLEWNHFAGTVNAQYHKMSNEARVIGGIAQSPIFSVNRPGFMNYGGLGTVLGHEIGHSFDVQGRQFNKFGQPGEWWDDHSAQIYKKWVESIIADFSSEAHQTSDTSAETVDGAKTVNEDISDILGLYIGYLSYQKYLNELENEGEKEKILPGLKQVAPQKLYFMKYANMWCDKKDVQARYNDMLGEHSPGNIRATVPIKRSKQFAETFGCPMPKDLFASE